MNAPLRDSSALRRFLTLVAALAIAGIATSVGPAVAQTDEDALRFSQRDPATGARLLGMAGASAAGVADWSTVYSNPAGLGWMKKQQAVGSLSHWTTLDDATYDLGGPQTFRDTRSNSTRLNNAAYVFKAPVSRGSLAFGLGYNETNSFQRELFFDGLNGSNSITDFYMPLPDEFALSAEPGSDGIEGTADDVVTPEFFRPLSFLAYEAFAIDFDPDAYAAGSDVPFLPAVVTGTVQQSGDVYERGGMGELAIAGAMEVSRDVMVGMSLNIAFGDYRFESLFDEQDINNANDGSGITTDFESVQMTEAIETDLVGVNLRTGLSAEVAEGLRVGLTVETPTYYTAEESYSTRIETSFDNGDAFSEQSTGTNEYHILTPWRFGGGLSYSKSGLTVSADAELVDWSQMRLEESTRADELYFDDINRAIRRKYEPTVNARFGAEYNLGSIAFRGGYAVSPNPIDSQTIGEDVLDAKREYVSAGIGFSVRNDLEINIGWMRELFDDQYAPYTEVDNAPFILEDVARDRVAVGVRVSF